MKKIFISMLLAALLSGCAATAYKTARNNANQVKNGMTLAQASAVLGINSNYRTPEYAEWRRGNAQRYNGTREGAIRFRLKDGIIVGVPDEGIFSPAGVQQYQDELVALAAANEAAEVAAAAQQKAEIAAEVKAAADSPVTCNDKITCSKVFALAQIYVSQNSDQKIQVATDTIIETYNPTDLGKIGIAISKSPRRGTTEVVSISPSCKEDKSTSHDSLCRLKRTRIYSGFRPFIESNLIK